MSEHMMPIPSRVYNSAVGGHVCGPEDIDFGQKIVHLIKYDKDGNEVSFESQVTQANKIYVIHDDFTLTSNVTVPANCVLEFDGGSIDCSNYVITGDKMPTNVVYTPEMFGAGKTSDDTKAIQSCVNIAKNVRMDGEYNVYVDFPAIDQWIGYFVINVPSNTNIELNGIVSYKTANIESYAIFGFIDCSNAYIYGCGEIIGDKQFHDVSVPSDWGYGISIIRSKNIIIDGLTIHECQGDCIALNWRKDNEDITIKNVHLYNCRRNGISLCSGKNIRIENFYIHDVYDAFPKAAIDVELESSGSIIENIYISQGKIEKCTNSIISQSGVNGEGINNLIIKDVDIVPDTNYTCNSSLDFYFEAINCKFTNIFPRRSGVLRNCEIISAQYIGNLTGEDETFDFTVESCVFVGEAAIHNSLNRGSINIYNCSSKNFMTINTLCLTNIYNSYLLLNSSANNFQVQSDESKFNNCSIIFNDNIKGYQTMCKCHIICNMEGNNTGVVMYPKNLYDCFIEIVGTRNTYLYNVAFGTLKSISCTILDKVENRNKVNLGSGTLIDLDNTYIVNDVIQQ